MLTLGTRFAFRSTAPAPVPIFLRQNRSGAAWSKATPGHKLTFLALITFLALDTFLLPMTHPGKTRQKEKTTHRGAGATREDRTDAPKLEMRPADGGSYDFELRGRDTMPERSEHS